jgi:hypothetical protein
MPFGGQRTLPEFDRREELDPGKIVRYSNPARRRGTVAMLLFAAVAILFILLKCGAEGLWALWVFTIWIIFALAMGWTRRELTLDRDRRLARLVKTPLMGDVETREITGDEVEAVEIEKDRVWEVWIHAKSKGATCLDSGESEEQMRRLAKDLSDALGVPVRDS